MTVFCPLHYDKQTKIQRPAVAVCHHCGRPLCSLIDLDEMVCLTPGSEETLCGYVIEDPFFYQDQHLYHPPKKANHCEKCLIENHRNRRDALSKVKKQND